MLQFSSSVLVYILEPSAAKTRTQCLLHPNTPLDLYDAPHEMQASSSCLQCVATTTLEEVTSWRECVDEFEVDEAGSCADLTAKACCYAKVSSNSACLSDDDFVSYAKCVVGTDCLPLTCGDTTIASATTTASGADCHSSPLGEARSGVASAATFVMALAVVIVSMMQM